MADRPKDADFNFSSMDWQAYVAFRPRYPDELYSAIYEYHAAHGGEYGTAIDIGAGIGVVSAKLIDKFSHVILTDPSEAYVSQAKAALPFTPKSRLSFLQTKAEDISLEQISGSHEVDLVTAAECLHWADLDVAVPRIAEVLKPGGTFAAWLYGVRPLLSNDDPGLSEARKIFYEIYDKMAALYDTQIEKQQASGGGAKMNSRLDCMAFDPNVWTDVRRVHTNRKHSMAHEKWPSTPSKVHESERIDDFQNQSLLQAERRLRLS